MVGLLVSWIQLLDSNSSSTTQNGDHGKLDATQLPCAAADVNPPWCAGYAHMMGLLVSWIQLLDSASTGTAHHGHDMSQCHKKVSKNQKLQVTSCQAEHWIPRTWRTGNVHMMGLLMSWIQLLDKASAGTTQHRLTELHGIMTSFMKYTSMRNS